MTSIYAQASREKLRFRTNVGMLSTEQLWDLPLTSLDALAVELEAEHKDSGKKSFLVKNSAKDKTAKLKFDIVLDILNTKMEEAEEAKTKAENKKHNDRILEAIAGKEDEELKGKSVAQLRKMLK